MCIINTDVCTAVYRKVLQKMGLVTMLQVTSGDGNEYMMGTCHFDKNNSFSMTLSNLSTMCTEKGLQVQSRPFGVPVCLWVRPPTAWKSEPAWVLTSFHAPSTSSRLPKSTTWGKKRFRFWVCGVRVSSGSEAEQRMSLRTPSTELTQEPSPFSPRFKAELLLLLQEHPWGAPCWQRPRRNKAIFWGWQLMCHRHREMMEQGTKRAW